MSGPTRKYLEVVFTVGPQADEHLSTDEAIRREITSWLESLGAEVELVAVRSADEPEERS